MSKVEHQLLGDVLLWSVASLFFLALPGYWYLRRKFPECGWNHGGNVTTAGLGNYDLVGVGALICFVAYMWKALPIGDAPTPEITAFLVIAVAMTYASIASMIPASLFWRVSLREFFGLRWGRSIQLLWVVPIFIAVIQVVWHLIQSFGWVSWATDQGADSQKSVNLLKETSDVKLIVAIAFGAVIAAPITEEIIFRGYLYPVVKRFTERNFATFFTGVIFGVAHFNLLGLPLLIFIGIALVVVYEYTGSIWAPIICHVFFNGLQTAVMLLDKYMPNGGLEFTQ